MSTTGLDKLIYISGSGRSGSTLVERMLHSSPDMFAIGECHSLWRLPDEELACSCGMPFADDPFWSEVGITRSERREMARLESVIARSHFILRNRFDIARLAADTRVRRFLDIQFGLYDRIARLANVRYIVDSSKAGPRAWLLACDDRTRILHLYRRPADVIASWRAPKFDRGLNRAMNRLSVFEASIGWWKAEQLVRLLPRDKVTRVDYLTLCRSLRREMDAILRALGLADIAPPRWIDERTIDPDPLYHTIDGNPDRYDPGPIRIIEREVDWASYPAVERHVIRAAGVALGFLFPPPPRAG